ncbi:gluconate 2-dehydrogenase subunit 3 family protein [Algoriphagus boritolerans]|uniref:Gluconate 2-dehydrogenase subunit 3 n=1 Tax=Algoriphagus boritolerans DSM 17298 = JCM 18970 TaxID=1120964 RepID=A0A1H5UXT9_9BACT|nr:gluconate 2-dehydrogenase subunit 3 family protein [Algoriphagus boritolerans]SEF79027.1 Gluconate 2-dehydrogenase subunit 3 [Algoriphagus boritolerans DSM 17298 = JCM 18970]
MDRRKSLKIIGGTIAGIAGLVLADSKWQIVDRLTHEGFFNFDEEQLISLIADTFIPAGLPPKIPTPDVQPIGALSTGTDQFLIKLFEKCYEKEDQDLIKAQLKALKKARFGDLSQEEREKVLLGLNESEKEDEKKFYNLMRSNTVMGFTTVKEVMVNFRKYQVAPGFYHGCVDVYASV